MKAVFLTYVGRHLLVLSWVCGMEQIDFDDIGALELPSGRHIEEAARVLDVVATEAGGAIGARSLQADPHQPEPQPDLAPASNDDARPQCEQIDMGNHGAILLAPRLALKRSTPQERAEAARSVRRKNIEKKKKGGYRIGDNASKSFRRCGQAIHSRLIDCHGWCSWQENW